MSGGLSHSNFRMTNPAAHVRSPHQGWQSLFGNPGKRDVFATRANEFLIRCSSSSFWLGGSDKELLRISFYANFFLAFVEFQAASSFLRSASKVLIPIFIRVAKILWDFDRKIREDIVSEFEVRTSSRIDRSKRRLLHETWCKIPRPKSKNESSAKFFSRAKNTFYCRPWS